jgi:aspartate racemase
MKTIGLIGGMSWESSIEYYRLVNELVRQSLGGLHSAECVMYSVDFAEVEAMQVQGRWEDAGQRLADVAQRLEAGGADFLVLCTNTMHKVADTVEQAVSVPLLHLGDTTATAVIEAGVRRVGLLGTGFTMSQSFYRDRLASHGLDVIIPDAQDQELVHRVIYDELCVGLVRDQSRQGYQDVIERLINRGAEGIILGCTEIELLIGQEHVDVPVFPTTRLHAQAAVHAALT